MAFNYQSAGPAGQTPLSPTSKDVQCKSFKIDFSATNATTAVAFDIGWLPKEAQIVDGKYICTTAVSGPSVTAATLSVAVGSFGNIIGSTNVFAQAVGNLPTATYFTTAYASGATTDQKVTGTLTLTGGTTATAGVIYVNLFYVI